MKKFNNLTKQLDLIFWPGGHFGAFFINLLNSCNITPADLEYKHFTLLTNKKEWSMIDHFSCYYYSREIKLDNLENHLIRLYGDKWRPYHYYVLYQYTHRYFNLKKGVLPDRSIEKLTEKDITALLKEPLHDINPKLKYTKCHENDYFYLNDNIKWNDKFAVILPENKKWIGDIMLHYKHARPHYYLERSLRDRFNYELFEQKNFKKIDIYGVVFNHDLSTVYEHFPKFTLTNREQKLLDQVRKDSLEILDLFGLSHEFEVNSPYEREKLIEKLTATEAKNPSTSSVIKPQAL